MDIIRKVAPSPQGTLLALPRADIIVRHTFVENTPTFGHYDAVGGYYHYGAGGGLPRRAELLPVRQRPDWDDDPSDCVFFRPFAWARDIIDRATEKDATTKRGGR